MPVDPTTIAPSIEQVASVIRTRTVDVNGNELGTFSAATRPTGPEVKVLIDRATRYVSLAVGERFAEWTAALIETAKDACASFAALYVEQSFYAHGSENDNSSADQLGRMAREQLGALLRDAGRGRQLRSIQMADPADPRPGNTLDVVANE